jgi:hypothetical protein
MAELAISAGVGAPPSPNRVADVRIVQGLLLNVAPPLVVRANVTGQADPATLNAIVEFQRRFMQQPDGRVEPDGRTLLHLNDGFASNYVGCDAGQRLKIDQDFILAQKWLDTVNRRLVTANDADMATKVLNIFAIDLNNPNDAASVTTLRDNFSRLRLSMDHQLTLQCENYESTNSAWVDLRQPSFVFFALNHFKNSSEMRVSKIIHERSHVIINTHHSGMAPGGEINFGEAPDDPKGFSIHDALDNAYCYEYLSISLQPNYRPSIWR